jgi:hypothetical protein
MIANDHIVVNDQVHVVDSDETHTCCGIFLLDPDVQQYPTDEQCITCGSCRGDYLDEVL